MAPKKKVTKGYKVTQAGLDAVRRNVATGQNGLGGGLSSTNRRNLDAMNDRVNRSNRSIEVGIRKGKENVERRFGTAIGAGHSNRFDMANTINRTSGQQLGAGVRAAKDVIRGGNEALDVLDKAAGNIRGAASYDRGQAALAQSRSDSIRSLAARAEVVQMKLQHKYDMQEMRLQARQEWNMFKKTQDYIFEQQNGGASGLTMVTQSAPEAASFIDQYYAANPDATPGQAALAYASDLGITDPADPRIELARQIASAQSHGMGAIESAQTAVSTLYGDVEGFDVKTVNSALEAGGRALNTNTITTLMAKGGDRSEEEDSYLAALLRSRGASEAEIDEILQTSASTSSDGGMGSGGGAGGNWGGMGGSGSTGGNWGGMGSGGTSTYG